MVIHRLPLVLVLPLQGCGCAQASPSLGLAFAGLWLCPGFPGSLSWLFWAVVVNRLPLVLVLALLWFFLGSPCSWSCPSLGLGHAFAGVWLCTGFTRSWYLLCWAVIILRIPLVLVLPLLGCCYAQFPSGLCLAFAELWLCTGFPQSLSYHC